MTTPVPWALVVACVAILFGCLLAGAGVYLLMGLAWALLMVAAPACFVFAFWIIRGMRG